MYHSQPYHHRPRSRASYFLPFISIIILGLIVVLVFQIVGYFQEKRLQALENKAAVSLVTGRAEMKIWGVPEWTSALDGSVLNEGDRLRTLPGSRAVMTLLNGGVIRLDAETEVEITALKSRDGQDDVELSLAAGQVWLKRSNEATVRTSLKVKTSHLEVRSIGTVFGVGKLAKEYARVLDGRVMVNVLVDDPEGGKQRTAETLEVALGQEVSLSQTDLADLQNNKPVNLLALLSDEFRDSEWYAWNRSEDQSAVHSIPVSDAVAKNPAVTLPESSAAAPPASVTEPPPIEVAAALTPPLILQPAETERTTKTGNVLVSGSVSTATQKIEVTTYVAGQAETYALQKYKPGSSSWTYLASREYGNFVPGANRYTVVAVGKDGRRSEPAEFTLMYDKPKEPADLSAPVVLMYNDAASSASSETSEDVVKVEGKIGKGILKMFVNDFALTRYVPESGVWIYYAKTAYGNLKEGANEYSVYGMDIEGNKTPVTKFTITKKPKPAETAPAPTTASEEPVL